MKEDRERKEILNKNYKEKQEKEVQEVIRLEVEVKKSNDQKEGFLNYISTAEDIEDILNNICEKLQKITGKNENIFIVRINWCLCRKL